jgi:hypothetical protein
MVGRNSTAPQAPFFGGITLALPVTSLEIYLDNINFLNAV